MALILSAYETTHRPTVLVAKQAATLDLLSGGRLRLGIGIGWNSVEYEALGENFHNRGRRSEEQIDVLRQLWTNELVTYEGRWHKITDAGLNPLPGPAQWSRILLGQMRLVFTAAPGLIDVM